MNENVLGPNVIRNSVMVEAEGLVNGARAAAYGHPMENFQRICALWNAYLAGRPVGLGGPITEEDHAIMMILVKIARLQETPDHRDSLVDICGYAGTYEKLLARRVEDKDKLEAQYALLALANELEGEPEPIEPGPIGMGLTRYACCRHCHQEMQNWIGESCNMASQHFLPCGVVGCDEGNLAKKAQG